mgnify:CR=1 FL=1
MVSGGQEVKFEFVSTDAQTAAAISIYDWDGVAITLGSSERLLITGWVMVVGSALTINVFSDNDADAAVDAGERMLVGEFAANGGTAIGTIAEGLPAKRGITPKVKASAAGNVNIVGVGRLLRGG